MDECVLTILAPPAIEEALVDWLLELPEEVVFSSEPVSYHGTEHGVLDVREQVTGSQRRLLFHLQIPLETARELCSRLRSEFPDSSLRYWISPVLESGLLGKPGH